LEIEIKKSDLTVEEIHNLLKGLAKYSDHYVVQKILEESFQSEGTIDE
jgi:hypothetical protein